MPVFKKKDKKENRSTNFAYAHGLIEYQAGDSINVTIDKIEKEVVIKARVFKREEFHIPFAQFLSAEHVSDVDLNLEYSNIISKANVPKHLEGVLGDIVRFGAGVDKKKSRQRDFILITYDVGKSQSEYVLLEIVGASIGWKEFLEELKSLIRQNGNSWVIK